MDPAKAQADAAEKRARHTFSVVLDEPGKPAQVLARDVYVAGDLDAFVCATSQLMVHEQVGDRQGHRGDADLPGQVGGR